MNALVMVLCLSVLFILTLITLALPEKRRRSVSGAAALVVAAVGIIFYGSGYAAQNLPFGAALLRALLAVCRMFMGINDYGSVSGAPLFRSPLGQTVFWGAHMLGFYVTASAAIAVFGNRLLDRIRLMLSRRGTLALIFGMNENALAYGEMLAKNRRNAVVFTGGVPDPDAVERIRQMGAAVLPKRNDHTLKRLGMRPGARHMLVAALGENRDENEQFAAGLLEDVRRDSLSSDQVRLILSCASEEKGLRFQAEPGTAGYCSVFAFHQSELIARYLILRYPPWEEIPFGTDGRAEEDLRILILGFGLRGRTVLRYLIMNGQFPGSRFRADIFDPRGEEAGGSLFGPGSPAREAYDIRFHAGEPDSAGLYRFLERKGDSLRMILLCLDSEEANQELGDSLQAWYETRDRVPRIVLCNHDSVFDMGQSVERQSLYAAAIPDLERLDRMAMEINRAYYGGYSETAETLWAGCDYFSRMSCRASAAFYPAVLRVAGTDRDQVMAGGWRPEGALLETLGELEHGRWCAFHRMMGYRTMPKDVFDERGRRYREGTLDGKIGKDTHRRLHACLIPWEDLPRLDQEEERWTGKPVDYRKMDLDNIGMLPRILRAAEQNEVSKDAV